MACHFSCSHRVPRLRVHIHVLHKSIQRRYGTNNGSNVRIIKAIKSDAPLRFSKHNNTRRRCHRREQGGLSGVGAHVSSPLLMCAMPLCCARSRERSLNWIFFTKEQNKCALSKLGAGARSSARNYLWKNCTHIGATLALHIQGSCKRVQLMVRRHSSQLQFFTKTGVSVAEIVNKSSAVAQAGQRVRRYRVCIVQNWWKCFEIMTSNSFNIEQTFLPVKYSNRKFTSLLCSF